MVDVPIFSQQDPRWKDNPLGNSSLTIGDYGCLMTSMTMVANYYNNNETPATVNEKMTAVGGFQEALIMPCLFPKAVPGMIYRDFVNCENSPAPMAEIDAYLTQGKPVIVEVDYSPNADLQNHWIVLYAKCGDDYLLKDPWPYPPQSGEVTLLTSRYKFAGDASQIIKGVTFLENSAAAPAPQTKPNLDKGVRASFPVYATADGLALRSDTVVADYTLIRRMPINTKMIVLETDEIVQPKIGVLNQWIPVLDPSDGAQGMTAAWYVSLIPPNQTAASSAIPAPILNKPLELIVKTIDEGVALRSQQPEINDATLIKRVPVNTEFVCTETYDTAVAKVGVVYQWLQVKDVTGAEYYIAAWYVKAVNGLATLGVKDQGAASFGLPGELVPEPLVVRTAVEGLALRRLPLIFKFTLIKRLGIDDELVVLEDPSRAEARLGKMGEWLHVCDVTGQEGYVAAWYCVRRPDLAIADGKPLLG